MDEQLVPLATQRARRRRLARGSRHCRPFNGIPYSWNPRHERGVGSFTLPVTPDGLWVGSDTDHAGNEFHQKIAFFPAAGGLTPPPIVTYSLPNDLYNMDQAGVGALSRRSYDLTTLGTTSTVPLGIDWRNARGAFMVNGNIYYGMSDGWLYKRTFNGTTAGAASQVNLYGLEVQPSTSFVIPGTTTRTPSFTNDIASATGMFYDNGRIYYTVAKTGTAAANNNKLYYRYFNPESEIVGASLFVASVGGEGINWGNVRGMTLASGKLIYALTDGRLYRVNWDGAKPTGPVTQISSATTWQSRGMFVYQQTGDSFAPSKPGKPAGTSASFDSIDLTWQASNDNAPGSLTYRIYRDGGEVGQVVSSSTGTVTYHDAVLEAGSTHTYQVDAVDAANNTSVISDVSDPITVMAPDITPPTDPGIPTGVGSATSRIDLTWAASADAGTTNLTYRVFRDDPGNQIAQFQSSSTTTVSFTDAGLWPGSTHDLSGRCDGRRHEHERTRCLGPDHHGGSGLRGRLHRRPGQLVDRHADLSGPRRRFGIRAQRQGKSRGAECVRLSGSRHHDEHGLRQRQHQRVEPNGRPRDRPYAAPHGGERCDQQGRAGHDGQGDRALRLRRHAGQLPPVARAGMEPSGALWLGYLGRRRLGPLPERREGRERLGREHGHRAPRSHPDR